MDKTKTIQICGQMRGKPDLNWPAFDNAARQLATHGWEPINPADMDRADRLTPDAFYAASESFQNNYAKKALTRCLTKMRDNAGAVFMLNGWRKSYGAKAERKHAMTLGLLVYYQTHGYPLPGDSPDGKDEEQ